MSRRIAAAPLAGLAAGLILAAPAAANPWFGRCMSPDSPAASLADHCKRALDWGSLDQRQQAMAWTNMGVGYAELGRHGDALQAYDRAATVDPAYFGLYPNRALSREARGQIRGALQDYERALELKPGDYGSLMGRGALYLKRGVADLALQDFSKAVEAGSGNVDALFNAGLALSALDRKDEAARVFSQVLERAPGDASAWLERGIARQDGDPKGALADFAKAMELDPFWSRPYVARGILHDSLGDREAANRDFRRAFELGHQAEWLNRRIEEMGG